MIVAAIGPNIVNSCNLSISTPIVMKLVSIAPFFIREYYKAILSSLKPPSNVYDVHDSGGHWPKHS